MCDEDTIVLISDDELQSNEEHGDVTETKRDMSPSEPGASRAEQPGEEDADRSCWLSGVECSSESDEDPAQGGSERAIPIQDKGREECSSNAAGDRPRMTSEEGRTDGSNHPSPCEFDALHAGGVSSDTESATAQPLNASTATHGVVLTPNALPRTGESENQSNNPQSEAKNIPNNRDENDVRDSQSVVKVRNQEGTGCLDKDESEASKANAREGFASDKIEPEHQNQVDLSDNSEEVPTTSSLDGSRPALRSLNDNDAETKQQDKKLSQSNQVVEVRDVEEWARLWRLRDVVKRKAIIQEHLRGKDVSDSLHDELLLGETASLEDRFELSCSFLIACVSIPPDAVQNDVLIAEACEGIRFVVKICEALVPDRDGYVVITERGTSHKSGLFLAFPFESFLTGAGTSGKAANLDLPTDALDAPHGIPIVCDVRSFRQDAEKLYKETKFGIRFQSLPSSTSSAYRQIFVVDEVPGILQGICKGVPFDSVSQNCKENPLQTQTQASGAEKDSCDTLDGRTESEDDIGISDSESPFELSPAEVEEMNSSDYDRACESNLDADVEDHDAHDAKEDGEKATSQLCEDVPADFQCDDPMIENSIASTQRNQDMELTLLRRIHAQFMWSGECVKEEKERKYYSAVMLKDGERVEIGSTVKLIAPQGQPFFLARVLQLWENISDGFKMMRCNWFYLNSEVKQSDVRNPKEVFASEHYDDQYLTTILTPCNIVHKCNIPAFEFASFLHGENNFFYERKFLPLKNMFVRVPPEKEAKKVKPAKPPAAEPKATKRCLSSVEKPAEDDRNGGNQQILPLKRILDTPLEPPSSSKHARLPSHQQPPTAPPQPQQPKSSEQLQYRGVERNEDGTFRAVAHIKGSKVSYAPFKSSKMAARAYDLMVCKETGPNTPSLNFNHDHAATLELQEILALLQRKEVIIRQGYLEQSTLSSSPFARQGSIERGGAVPTSAQQPSSRGSDESTSREALSPGRSARPQATTLPASSGQHQRASYGRQANSQRPLRTTTGQQRHTNSDASATRTAHNQREPLRCSSLATSNSQPALNYTVGMKFRPEPLALKGELLVSCVPATCKVVEGEGLSVGDQVITIDNKPVKGLNQSDVERLLVGPANSRVKLRCRSSTGKEFAAVLERTCLYSETPHVGTPNLQKQPQTCDKQISHPALNEWVKTLEAFTEKEDRELSRLAAHSEKGAKFLNALREEEMKTNGSSIRIEYLDKIIAILRIYNTHCSSFASKQQAYEAAWQRALDGEQVQIHRLRGHKEEMDGLAGELRTRTRRFITILQRVLWLIS